MQLNTFSAILDTAISLETALGKRYEAASGAEAEMLYRELAKDGRKRIRYLERIRREMVTEMILEPIRDLTLPDALTGLLSAEAASPPDPAKFETLERAMADFYNKAAEKIGLDEAARALRKMAKGSNRRAERLAALAPG